MIPRGLRNRNVWARLSWHNRVWLAWQLLKEIPGLAVIGVEIAMMIVMLAVVVPCAAIGYVLAHACGGNDGL